MLGYFFAASAAFFCAFFSFRGSRTLFLGSSFPLFRDFVAGLTVSDRSLAVCDGLFGYFLV